MPPTRLSGAAIRSGPLHGVPFTLKDAHQTAGMRTTVGFPPFADYVPAEDSVVVARLKAAGAILIGKTNTAMLLADFQTSNPLFGKTNNPWDVARTPGGSSGGAAAALAAGMTPFEIGTDMQSSIRLPAHFCGVFGLKPTENRVSLEGGFPNPGGDAAHHPHHELHRPDGSQRRGSGVALQDHRRTRRTRHRSAAGTGRGRSGDSRCRGCASPMPRHFQAFR